MNSNVLFYEPIVGTVDKSPAAITEARRGLLGLVQGNGDEVRFPGWETSKAIQIMIKTPMLRNGVTRQIGSMSSSRPPRPGATRAVKVRRQTHSTQAPKLTEPVGRPLRRMSISQRKMQHTAKHTKSTMGQCAEEAKASPTSFESPTDQLSSRQAVMSKLRFKTIAQPEGDLASRRQRQRKALHFLRECGNGMKALYRQQPRVVVSQLPTISEVCVESNIAPTADSLPGNIARPSSGASTEASSPAMEVKVQSQKPTQPVPPKLDFAASFDSEPLHSQRSQPAHVFHSHQPPLVPQPLQASLQPPLPQPLHKPPVTPSYAPSESPTAAEKSGAATLRPQQRRRAEKKRRYTTSNDYIPSEHVSTFAATIERLAFEPIIKPEQTE
jgi:hypothetical protein